MPAICKVRSKNSNFWATNRITQWINHSSRLFFMRTYSMEFSFKNWWEYWAYQETLPCKVSSHSLSAMQPSRRSNSRPDSLCQSTINSKTYWRMEACSVPSYPISRHLLAKTTPHRTRSLVWEMQSTCVNLSKKLRHKLPPLAILMQKMPSKWVQLITIQEANKITIARTQIWQTSKTGRKSCRWITNRMLMLTVKKRYKISSSYWKLRHC